MALGFQRIYDTSPLSMKLLNDQLEQIWKKIMGGLDTVDFTEATRSVVNNAVSNDRFSSVIEQFADEIRLAASATGSDNLIRNGNGLFGVDGWTFLQANGTIVSDTTRGSVFSLDKAGSASQSNISLKADVEYTLGFYFICYEGLSARVGDIAVGDAKSAGAWEEYTLTFTPTKAGTYAVTLNAGGVARISDIMLCEGTNANYRQNPNEIHNSSITLTNDRVLIDTENFGLCLRNSQGEAITEMSADAQGFSQLYVANELYLRGKSMYLGPGRYDLWVHPDAEPSGVRRYFYSGESAPASLEGTFPDIQEAIDFIPRWCDGDVHIHVYGGSAWQYPSNKIDIANFFGGGSVWLEAWQNPFTVKRMEIRNNKLVVEVRGAQINSCGYNDCFTVSNSVAQFGACSINGRGVLTGTTSAGYVATWGALASLSSCQAHNCDVGGMALNGGHLTIVQCEGSGNAVGLHARQGGIVTAANSVWKSATATSEVSGGKILTTTSVTAAGTAPAATPMESYIQLTATVAASYRYGVWTTSPDHLSMLNGSDGVLWFDKASTDSLGGKTIVAASLTLRRRGSGGRANAVPITLLGASNAGASGQIAASRNYGSLGAWSWGEKRTVGVPTNAINDLRSGAIKSFVLRCAEDSSFEGVMGCVHEGLPRLEIVYR